MIQFRHLDQKKERTLEKRIERIKLFIIFLVQSLESVNKSLRILLIMRYLLLFRKCSKIILKPLKYVLEKICEQILTEKTDFFLDFCLNH